jgi:predicted  nucleic acid-binding Zn-ribbon protein
MDKVQTLIVGIDYKSRQIVEANHNLKTENSVLKQRINMLETQLRDILEANKRLEGKIKQINIGKTIKRSDITESRTKINELVRKIDKCIALVATT